MLPVNNIWTIVALIAVVFVLTYDPKSRMLEHFMGQPTPPSKQSTEAVQGKNCKHQHAEAIQLGTDYACPKDTKTNMGAIYHA